MQVWHVLCVEFGSFGFSRGLESPAHIVLVRWADGEVKIVSRQQQLQPGPNGLLKWSLLAVVSTVASTPATQLSFSGMGLEVRTRRIDGCSPILDTLSQDDGREN